MWFQNLDDSNDFQSDRLIPRHFRGSFFGDLVRGHRFYYEVVFAKKGLGFKVVHHAGDCHSDLKFIVTFLFFRLFFIVHGVFKPFEKDEHGRFKESKSTGLEMDKFGISGEWNVETMEWSSKQARFRWWWPWDYAGPAHKWVLNKDGKWVDEIEEYKGVNKYPFKDGRKVYVQDFTYTLRSGEVQERTAYFCVKRRVWYPRYQRWLSFLKWPKKDLTSLDIRFNESLGEGVNSWKGGTLGLSCPVEPGETPIDAFNRIQKERKFE